MPLQDDLRAALVGTRFSAHIHHFPVVDSTNTQLLAAAAAGAPEGTLYIADEQTAGRGRGGHSWHSAPGDGVYLSVLIKPSLRLREGLLLSLATGLAAQAAILASSCVHADIRWPNDLMVGQQKVGGILVETAAGSGDDAPLRYAVIGIGINLNQESFPMELYPLATSLRLVCAKPQDRLALLIALLRSLDRELTLLENEVANAQKPSLLDRFSQASAWVHDRRVSVPEQGGYTGTTAGLDNRGFLLVNADDGTQRTVLSGGVRDIL